MFRSQSSDQHQGSITVLVQLLLIGVHALSYTGNVAVCCLYVCVYDVPVRVVFGYVLYFFPFKKSPKTECRLDSGAD